MSILALGDASQSAVRPSAGGGLSVTECSDSGRALEMLKQRRYAVLLCDFKAEGINSVDLLRSAREGYPEVATVLTTQPQELRHGILAMIDGASDRVNLPSQVLALQQQY